MAFGPAEPRAPREPSPAPCKRPPAGTAKEVLRAKLYTAASNDKKRLRLLLGTPANINRRTGKPHKHQREIARNKGL